MMLGEHPLHFVGGFWRLTTRMRIQLSVVPRLRGKIDKAFVMTSPLHAARRFAFGSKVLRNAFIAS